MATVYYTDISSGLDYTICQKFRLFDPHGGIVFSENSFNMNSVSRRSFTEQAAHSSPSARYTLLAYVKRNCFPLALDSSCLIHAEVISAQHGPDCVRCDVHFDPKTDYPADFFTMLCIPRPMGENWAVYRELGCSLVFDLQVSERLTMVLELKQTDGSLLISFPPEFTSNFQSHWAYPLQKIPEEQPQQVKELCFTIFNKNVSSPCRQGVFTLSACALDIL